MDKTSRDKLSGAVCDFLSDVIRIADEGNYDRDRFVKADDKTREPIRKRHCSNCGQKIDWSEFSHV